MPCGYGTLRTTGVILWHEVSRRACAEVSAALEVSRKPVQRSQQLHNSSILHVKSYSILNPPPSLPVLSEACYNALTEAESTLKSSRGGWEHLEVLRSTGEGYRSVREVLLQGFLIPEINKIFIRLSTTGYLFSLSLLVSS